ncbi:lactonase family protein [Martelella mediterranea]|uniref:lactonase family protein n=1 Tax=Martelella mediterranea TaxID=293089 RepID=UPI001E3C24B2|nr:lactonase family protein [Martelella mediterranea]MCD1635785.1 lactonase family protein [Martelella mediterranea]
MDCPAWQVYIGTYTEPLDGHGQPGPGVAVIELDRDSGAAQVQEALSAINPSYIAISADGSRFYCVREVFGDRQPALAAYRRKSKGSLEKTGCQPVSGDLPCHLALDETGWLIATAQYGGGNVALFPLDENGDPQPAISLVRHSGRGRYTARQEGPHAHCVLFDGTRQLLVADLGLDSIFVYQLDPATGGIDEGRRRRIALPAGCGPRHMVLSTDLRFLYVACELDETIVTLKRNGDDFEISRQTVIFADAEDGNGTVAAIRLSPDGRHLYVSGRRQGKIACLALDADGLPRVVAAVSSGGEWPRDVALSPEGRFLLAANQQSGNVCIFRRDAESGMLAAIGTVPDLGAPAVIAFA